MFHFKLPESHLNLLKPRCVIEALNQHDNIEYSVPTSIIISIRKFYIVFWFNIKLKKIAMVKSDRIPQYACSLIGFPVLRLSPSFI